MCRFASCVTVLATTFAAATAQAEPAKLDLRQLVLGVDDAVPATITYSSSGWTLRGLVSGGLAFGSSEYLDELVPDTMDLVTTESAMSPMIETGLKVGRDLIDGVTVAAGPKYRVTLGSVMPGNERHLTLLVGFARRAE